MKREQPQKAQQADIGLLLAILILGQTYGTYSITQILVEDANPELRLLAPFVDFLLAPGLDTGRSAALQVVAHHDPPRAAEGFQPGDAVILATAVRRSVRMRCRATGGTGG